MRSRKIVLLLAFILGIIGLWMMTALNIPDACEYTNSNLEYIKSKIQKAVAAEDLQIARYNAYKALNGIEKSKVNMMDCGCRSTMDHMENALSLLKTATKANSLDQSKSLLDKALQNTVIGLEVLRDFKWQNSSPYGTDLLVMNTKSSKGENWLFRIPDGKVKEQVEKSLMDFEMSLNMVVENVDCKEAYRFVSNIYEESRSILFNSELSDYKKQYHLRVKNLTMAALQNLGGCP